MVSLVSPMRRRQVLGVVPNIDDEPSDGDVGNDQIADGEDSKMGQHVERMHFRQPALAPSEEAPKQPER